MKKSLVLVLALALVLCGSVAAGAFEAPKVTVGAGYLFGTATLDTPGEVTTFADKGIVLTADATLTGPFGVMVNYVSLTGSDFEVDDVAIPEAAGMEDSASRIDIFASYAPAFGKGGLKFLAGYSSTEENMTVPGDPEQTMTVKGPMVGGALAVPVNDKLILSGFVGYGVGMTWEASVGGVDVADGDAGLLTYRLAGTYLVTSNVAVEAGYIGNDYTLEGVGGDVTESVGGFFVGARALF